MPQATTPTNTHTSQGPDPARAKVWTLWTRNGLHRAHRFLERYCGAIGLQAGSHKKRWRSEPE